MPCVGEVTLSRELCHCLSLHSWHKQDTLLGLAYSPAPHLWACRCLHLHLRLTWQSRARLSADSFVDEISSKFCFLIQPTYKWKSWFMLEYLVEVSCKKCQSYFRSLYFYLHFSTTTLKLHNGFPWFSPPFERWDLDQCVPEKPAVFYRRCHHVAVLNSVALKACSIGAETKETFFVVFFVQKNVFF